MAQITPSEVQKDKKTTCSFSGFYFLCTCIHAGMSMGSDQEMRKGPEEEEGKGWVRS